MNDSALQDVAYTTVDSPLGRLLLVATPIGLLRIAFAAQDHARVLEQLASMGSPRILRSPSRLDATVRALDEYFNRKRTEFNLDLDHSLSHGFRRVVRQYLPLIGYGQTRTYRNVAESVENPKAVRAVGSACATNPLPIVVPCHRVIRTDGSLGGYLGGLSAKTTLLALEGAR